MIRGKLLSTSSRIALSLFARFGAGSSMRQFSNVGVQAPMPTCFGKTNDIPNFGTSKKRQRVEAERALQNKAVADEHARRRQAPSRDVEDDAEVACRVQFGFLEKPLYMSYWSHFLAELKQIEFRWSLTPGIGATYHLKIIEHDAVGEHELCHLIGEGSHCHPIADMFEGISGILQGTFLSFSVPFISHAVNSGSPQNLVLEAKPQVGASSSSTTVEKSNQASPEQATARHGLMFQTAKTGYCLDLYLMEKGSPIKVPLFHSISLQAVCHAHLTSIPLFLRRTDIGIANYDFFPPDQMTMFRFVWCFMRRECRMSPVELGELNELLPAK